MTSSCETNGWPALWPISNLGWGLLSQFFPFCYFPHFSLLSKQTKNITFIFGRCHRSSAVVTPVKYECDSANLTGTFARSKIVLTEKLAKGALVSPTLVCLINGMHMFIPYDGSWDVIITTQSTRRLLMAWCLFGSRTSAPTMKT